MRNFSFPFRPWPDTRNLNNEQRIKQTRIPKEQGKLSVKDVSSKEE